MVYLVLLKSLLYMKEREERNVLNKKLKKQKLSLFHTKEHEERKIKIKTCQNQKNVRKKISNRSKLHKKKAILCRICNKGKGLISIFNNTLQIDIAQEILNFSGVVIQPTDKSSKFVCKRCVEQLNGCLQFRDLCRKHNEYVMSVTTHHSASKKTESQDSFRDSQSHSQDFETIINATNTEDEDSYSLPSLAFSEEFKIYTCPTCDQPFHELLDYNLHLMSCNGQSEEKTVGIQNDNPKRRFLCDICGKTISTRATLNIHMRIHKDVFPFHCDECPYRGRTIDLLRVHKRTHLTEKPYKCNICTKTATTASNLQRHMRNAHSTARPFKCIHCDRSYRLQREVDRHMTEAHTRQNSVHCQICDKMLSSLNALSKHRRKVHNIKGRNGRMPSYLQCEMAAQQVDDARYNNNY